MNNKAKEQRNAYMKAWRARNKDKVKAAQKDIGKEKLVMLIKKY
ncbi:hypothetical protein [Clostridium botulinum]|nr:hypothetical protein [Clostridium botulinum]